ncbi:hypothetical protein E1298_40140 [Actinomadura rubrisoli]|uniref:Uncharacterized protein n=1 Tax=Actinomadura rubrisoli TaxID=2530368 RepID=A0A4R5A401_9ACTN|nr:hypothetical protein E1298_40140 [Actinomadura rubrisoli]
MSRYRSQGWDGLAERRSGPRTCPSRTPAQTEEKVLAARRELRADPDHIAAFDGAAAVSFRVELAFEGVVDRLDELADALEQVLTRPGLLTAHRRPQHLRPVPGQLVAEPAGPKALVGDQQQSRLAASSGSIWSIAATTSCSSGLELTSAQLIGIPAGVQTKYSRRPQNQPRVDRRYP